MAADGGKHRSRLKFEETADEIIRMPRLQTMRSQSIRRKIPQVPRYDDVRPSSDCRRQNMPVPRVGQVELRD